jgi:hypothetical protein
MSIPASKPTANHRPPAWVILVTVAWLALIAGAAWWKWDSLCQMGLNELGDFAAGAAAPLAFFWLIAGYFQQGIELRQNTEALRLQAEELARSVEQQKALATVAAEQATVAKKAWEEQRRELERSHQPRLALAKEFMKGDRAGNLVLFDIEIKNLGSPLFEGEFHFDRVATGPTPRMSGDTYGRFVIPAAGSAHFRFVTDINDPEDSHATLHYLDGMGERQEMHLALHRYDTNKLKALLLHWVEVHAAELELGDCDI